MKKLFTLFLSFTSLWASAQIPNASFKDWTKVTKPVALPVLGNTNVTYTDPDNWTSLNQISNLQVPLFGILGKESVKKDSIIKKDSSASARLRTEELAITGFGTFQIPGLLFNGKATLDFGALTGGDFSSFLTAPGAGQPISSRPKGIRGFYKYLPVSNDTFDLYAVLRKGDEIVASARLQKNTLDTANWQSFYLQFAYESCTMPDTMFIVFSSLNLESVGSGGHKGTTLWVDSVSIDSLLGYNPPLPPNAIDDDVELNCLTGQDINFTANDKTCGLPVKVKYLGQLNPTSGSAIISGSGMSMKVTYTPLLNNNGSDVLFYTLCDTVSNLCDTGYINISIPPIVNIINKDTLSTPKNSKVNIFVKNNDTITTCYLANLTISKNPSNGTAIVKNNNSIEYTPNADFVGADTFRYKICGNVSTYTICDSAAVIVKVTGTTSAIFETAGGIIRVYPNPVTNYLTIEQQSNSSSIEIVSMTGQVLMTKSLIQPSEQIDVAALEKGGYILRLYNQLDQSTKNILFNIVK
jgi:hypothetical protein